MHTDQSVGSMSSARDNQAIVLAQRPKRGPITNETFKQVTRPVPELQNGQVLVRLDYVSVVCLFLSLRLQVLPHTASVAAWAV